MLIEITRNAWRLLYGVVNCANMVDIQGAVCLWKGEPEGQVGYKTMTTTLVHEQVWDKERSVLATKFATSVTESSVRTQNLVL